MAIPKNTPASPFRPAYAGVTDVLVSQLAAFGEEVPLPGLVNDTARRVLASQIVDSQRREDYFHRIVQRTYTGAVADPALADFDPLKAAVFHWNAGNAEEAGWLIFLFVHFGKNRRSGWDYIRAVYGRNGQGGTWDWEQTFEDIISFRFWLGENEPDLRASSAAFGNHRKYQSISAWERNGTGEAIASYVTLIQEVGSHAILFSDADQSSSPEEAYDDMYHQLSSVVSFGRTAKFDYLTAVGRLGFAQITAGRGYLKNATGPLDGSRLLFGRSDEPKLSASDLEGKLHSLASAIGYGPSILEDAICNWQKDPQVFYSFRG
jgi:hypothetical protein